MTNPTSNFGWQMPTSTDLVTDLPADFETFGQAVDTSMADLKGGTTGQILSKTTNTDMDFTWITNDVGDITAVTAGTGISGGGTSGAVTVTNSMATTMTTKGDLVPATGSGTFARLAVGANGETLVADSSTATGLKWAKSPNFVGCILQNTAAQSIANATSTVINWNQENVDTDNFHNNSTNTSRITIPAGLGGKYLITSNIRFASNALGVRFNFYNINGADSGLGQSTNAISGFDQYLSTSLITSLSAGDYVEAAVYQSSTAALNVLSFSAFSVIYLGA